MSGGRLCHAGPVGGAPQTRYASSGPLTIAYQDTGDGVPLVWVPGFVSHVELQRDLPCFAGFIERLERFARLVTFDKRGTGLSDRSLGVGTLEDRMDDIRAVCEACGLERAAVFAVSEGGPLAIMYAATYPERVSHLVLYSSTVGPRLTAEQVQRFTDRVTDGWGSGVMADLVIQHVDDSGRAAMGRFERYACTPSMVRTKLLSDASLDVRAAAGALAVPTLVMHNRNDPFMRIEWSRDLAARIPGARFVELDGDFHASWRPHDYDAMVGQIEEFVTGTHSPTTSDRVLSTVVFSDIVDSTRRAGEVGDRAWHDLLDRHDQVLRTELARHRGREVNTTGDGFFAAFDGPGRAIRGAVAMSRAASALGLDVRVGIHTGECEVRGDDLAGIAVHIGARVAQLAAPGQVVVTGTVRDLVAGSGIAFEDLGLHGAQGRRRPVADLGGRRDHRLNVVAGCPVPCVMIGPWSSSWKWCSCPCPTSTGPRPSTPIRSASSSTTTTSCPTSCGSSS